jgi:hypothetical protein
MKRKTYEKAIEIDSKIELVKQKIQELKNLSSWFSDEHAYTNLDTISFNFSKKDKSRDPVPGEKGKCSIVFSDSYMNLYRLGFSFHRIDQFISLLEEEQKQLEKLFEELKD